MSDQVTRGSNLLTTILPSKVDRAEIWMNHRRRKAMRFVELLWITKEPRRALVFYLINTPLPKSRFLACISSRITTGIQVERYYQINDNWFNEPFAVSPYRLLILRHAWLNLWDKHMTTGRINQVTILRGRSHTLEGAFTPSHTPPPKGWSGYLPKPGAEPEPDAPPGGPPGPKPPRDPTGDPIAPTELPKERSGTDVGIRDAERRPTLHHTHLGWRIPVADHMGPLSCSEAANRMPTDTDSGWPPNVLG